MLANSFNEVRDRLRREQAALASISRNRVADWQKLMQEEIEAASNRPFEYGVHDCCIFAARVADAIGTNYHFVSVLARLYQDAAGARALLAQSNHSLLLLVNRIRGVMAQPVADAQPGDLVLHGSALGLALGICTSSETFVGAARIGTAERSMRMALYSWPI